MYIMPEKESKASILVVDDVPRNIQVLGNILKTEGYDVEFSTSGKDALDWLKTKTFDLVLLDIMMPKMDGFEVCRKMKEDVLTKDIPIIFITAKSDIEDITRGFNMGVVDYITKPFNTAELLVRLTTHLKIQRQNRELIRMNALRVKLMSIIAHDLKIPMSIISNMVTIAIKKNNKQKTEEVEQILELIDCSIKESFDIVDDVIWWGRIQMTSVKPDLHNANLYEQVNEIINNLDFTAGDKGVKLINNIPVGLIIRTVPELVKVVVRNLIANSIKFTPSGGQVTIYSESSKQDNSTILIIKDSGIGISKSLLSQLFSNELMITSQGSLPVTGTGLGLFICKDIMEFLDGKIEVESKKGKGSTFRLIFHTKG